MRRPLVVLSLLAVALLVSACAASEPPGWTFAPPTQAPTPGSSQPAAASPAASDASPSAGGSEGAGGGSAVVDITAQNIAFTTTDVSAPANTPFTIHFDNQDTSTIHNVVIKDSSGTADFTGDLVTGPTQTDYNVPALPAGTYTFVCSVHPNMVGTLTVGP